MPKPQISAASSARFRLHEAGATLDLAALRAEAATLAARLAPSAGRRVAVAPGRLRDLIAALFASEEIGADLMLLRAWPATQAERTALAVECRLSAVVAPSADVACFPGADDAGARADLLLMTSGTTGTAKVVRHTRQRLLAPILRSLAGGGDWTETRWLLAYPANAFAGLQIILTSLVAGAMLIAPAKPAVVEIMDAALRANITHVSGTPTFWRAFLLALGSRDLPLAAVTLGGETADQTTLDRLAEKFPAARIRHVYASSEAGTLFSVSDGRAGFPAAWLDDPQRQPALRLRDEALEVQSPTAMLGYDGIAAGGPKSPVPALEAAWIETGDLIRIEDDRCLFAGRRDALVNVGGVKVSPEHVESLLLALPEVWDALVESRANPITGTLLTARVQPSPAVRDLAPAEIKRRIADQLGARLTPAERPRLIEIVAEIGTQSSGKKTRVGASG